MEIEIEKHAIGLQRKMLSPFASFAANKILCIKSLMSGYVCILPLHTTIFLIYLIYLPCNYCIIKLK